MVHMAALTQYLHQIPVVFYWSFKILCLILPKQDTLCHVICCILGLIFTSHRASFYEYLHSGNLESSSYKSSLKLSFHSDHRFKHIFPTLNFSGNKHSTNRLSNVNDSRNNVKLWSLIVLFFSSYYSDRRN